MAVPVAVFNAGSQSVSVTVNQGPQIPVGPTGPSFDWAPQPQRPGLGPTYAPGNPAPNVIGNVGSNSVQAFVADVPIGGGAFQFSISSGDPVRSIQLYFFFADVQNTSWLALIDGKPLAQRVTFSTEAGDGTHGFFSDVNHPTRLGLSDE